MDWGCGEDWVKCWREEGWAQSLGKREYWREGGREREGREPGHGWGRRQGLGETWVEAWEAGHSPCWSCSSYSPRCSPSALTAATVCGRAAWCCVRTLGSVSSPRAFLRTPSPSTWRGTTSARSPRAPLGKEDNNWDFFYLPSLLELYLSHNRIDTLSSGALRHLSSELRLLDLSHNLLRQASRDEFSSTRAKTRLYHNPWHCDCTLQELVETLNLEPETVNGIVCESSVRSAGEHAGQPLVKLLDSGVNFCNLQRKTTDVAMLVTMFVWFFMVIVYVVYYVRQNQAETRRHLEYLKSLPSPRKTVTETDTISTGL
ncbi:unnamed protein product [Oncorhynchus mykiss]|uniref:LRRNT domain-containing protein n=1 Tax=Oncorhynchus mykiss TaxID=8022 RepID=A0A060ZMI2_ONCMY|nr:unnamed protein product [Oncorhynchus mykiss]